MDQPEQQLWGVVVDEVRLNSLGTAGGAWWQEQAPHFYRSSKLRYLVAIPFGAVVELGPYPQDDAEFMRDHMVEHGVHHRALTVRRWTDQPHMPKCSKAKPCRLCTPVRTAPLIPAP